MKTNLSFEQLPEAIEAVLNELSAVKRMVSDGFKNTKPEPTDHYLTIEQAGEYLKLAKGTMYAKVSRGEIPYLKRAKRLYFSESDLREYIDSGRRLSNAEISQQADNYIKRKGGQV